MKKTISWLHISDIHFNFKKDWSDDTSRDKLLTHFTEFFSKNEELKPDFIFCTGDIAYGETSAHSLEDQYQNAESFFLELLKISGKDGESLGKDRLYMVPGNHDVNRKVINADAQTTMINWAGDSAKHIQTINQRFNDRTNEFKDALKRLAEYDNFVRRFLPHQIDDSGRLHYSSVLEVNEVKVGISGFNSAWSCSGPEDDRNIWLAAEWQLNKSHMDLKDADIKIGLIHHPIDWLNTSDRDVCNKRISSEFDFWLHGHSHSAWVNPGQTHIVIAAGATCAETKQEFGVNLTSINCLDSTGHVYLFNKSLDDHGWALAPVSNHAPEGKWSFKLPSKINTSVESKSPMKESSHTDDLIDRYLTKKFEDALQAFGKQPKVWVTPTISASAETEKNSKEQPKVELSNILQTEKSLIIKSPPQYGLTCLSHYLIREIWRTKKSIWLYLDSRLIKPHKASIQDCIDDELEILGLSESEIKCVILDSWNSQDKDAFKLLKNLSDKLGATPIVCMQTVDDGKFNAGNEPVYPDRKFDVFYLWSLNRGQIHTLVSEYNNQKTIGDDDAVTKRLVNDLDVLNLHRTPMNCFTLLKASEVDFDENPVNRSEVLKRVLFLLFNVDYIPTYKSKPDLKDCEFVIGHFCEMLMRSGGYCFTRDRFLLELNKFCKINLIDLEVQIVFDVLYTNNILIKQGSEFCFKCSYWVFYFAAQRMHHDKDFRDFVFDKHRYLQYPELVEFYTGIDRAKEDAVVNLTNDLKLYVDKVKTNNGFPANFNPYKFAKWESTPETQERMHKEIEEGINDSALPAEVKDRFADRYYDQSKPYDQSIKTALYNESFYLMLSAMKASARALRNSDYVKPELKINLLREIINSWEEATRVLFVVLPILAEKGFAVYEGTGILLVGGFGQSAKEKFINILEAIPANVSSWVSDDLFSPKLDPYCLMSLKAKA